MGIFSSLLEVVCNAPAVVYPLTSFYWIFYSVYLEWIWNGHPHFKIEVLFTSFLLYLLAGHCNNSINVFLIHHHSVYTRKDLLLIYYSCKHLVFLHLIIFTLEHVEELYFLDECLIIVSRLMVSFGLFLIHWKVKQYIQGTEFLM